ncbi:MAG: hypothetical protein ACE5GK_01325 [Nitrospiria bacterium]
MTIAFEKLTSPIYPAYLKVGDYSIALEPEMIESLKGIQEAEASLYLVKLIEKVGLNRYLREMIEEEIKKGDDQEVLVKGLRAEIHAL